MCPWRVSALLLACAVTVGSAHAEPFGARAEVRAALRTLAAEHDLDPAALQAMFDRIEPNQRVLELISTPAEKRLEWRDYRLIFLTDERIAAGRRFLATHRADFDVVERKSGVPREFIAAIIGVETYFGRVTGGFPVAQALATLAFDYPPRSRFFLSELGEFLELATRESWQSEQVLGSYAGAMGLPQFMPSSYRAYAVDAQGDGLRDLFGSVPDAIASVANYLLEHGWQPGGTVAERWWQDTDGAAALVRDELKPAIAAETVREAGFDSPSLRAASAAAERVSVMRFAGVAGEEWVVGYNNFYAITRYNHSRLYARAVLQLAHALAS